MAVKILFIASSWPREAGGFGGQLRALQLGRALKRVGSVDLAIVGSDANDTSAQQEAEGEYPVIVAIEPAVERDGAIWATLRRAFDSKYLNIHGYVAPKGDREGLLPLLTGYDLVWVLNSRTPNILQQWDWPNTHLDIDDVPSTYLRAVARSGKRLLKRAKAAIWQRLMKRRELLFKHRFTTLSVCSEEDRQYLGGGDQIHVIPNGFQRPSAEPLRRPASDPPRIGFIGLCTYEPNAQGIRWLFEKCWLQIQREIPGIRFRLVGKGSDELFSAAGSPEGVDVLGFVNDSAEEIATWSAMVIPILLGGGTRIKIADAFSRKCPVVSTSLGAFGYEVQSGRELLLADDPGEFAAACISLVGDQLSGAAMAERAYTAFLEKWTWDAIAPRVWAAAEDCLRRSRGSEGG